MRRRIRQRLSGTGETLHDRRIHPLQLSLWIAKGLLVVLGLDFADDFLARAAEPDPTITARVINYTASTPATMAKAEYQAERILGEAGLHVIWLDCPRGQSAGITTDRCKQPLKPSEVVLRVLSDHRVVFKTMHLGLQSFQPWRVSTTNMRSASRQVRVSNSRSLRFLLVS